MGIAYQRHRKGRSPGKDEAAAPWRVAMTRCTLTLSLDMSKASARKLLDSWPLKCSAFGEADLYARGLGKHLGGRCHLHEFTINNGEAVNILG
jgi:hypothetical protein